MCQHFKPGLLRGFIPPLEDEELDVNTINGPVPPEIIEWAAKEVATWPKWETDSMKEWFKDGE